MDSFNEKIKSKVGLLTPSHSYKPFRYPWAYDFLEKATTGSLDARRGSIR